MEVVLLQLPAPLMVSMVIPIQHAIWQSCMHCLSLAADIQMSDGCAMCRDDLHKQRLEADQHFKQLQQRHADLIAAATADKKSVSQVLHLLSETAAQDEMCRKVCTCSAHK